MNGRTLAAVGGGTGNGEEGGVWSPQASSCREGQPHRKERASWQDELVKRSRSEKGVVNSGSGVT